MSQRKFYEKLGDLIQCMLDDMVEQNSDFHDRWNFITDIETNEIRSEGEPAAVNLAINMLWVKLYDLTCYDGEETDPYSEIMTDDALYGSGDE
ncbi:MAG: hypothetical protein ACW99G_19320 [Candidatus Thorarchaeota archaeon]|jgi:hypothetical protein